MRWIKFSPSVGLKIFPTKASFHHKSLSLSLSLSLSTVYPREEDEEAVSVSPIMAADVSSLVRVLGRDKQHRTVGNESSTENSTAPITRDLLGGSSKFVESQELDLDLQVPNGWEKRLDLKVCEICSDYLFV